MHAVIHTRLSPCQLILPTLLLPTSGAFSKLLQSGGFPAAIVNIQPLIQSLSLSASTTTNTSSQVYALTHPSYIFLYSPLAAISYVIHHF